MAKPAEDERLTFLQSVICGGIAGVLSRTLTSPLEVVKVLAQVGTPESRVGFLRSFNRIYRSEGLKAFWKGNGISCLRLVPYSAIQLAAFHNLLVSHGLLPSLWSKLGLFEVEWATWMYLDSIRLKRKYKSLFFFIWNHSSCFYYRVNIIRLNQDYFVNKPLTYNIYTPSLPYLPVSNWTCTSLWSCLVVIVVFHQLINRDKA